MALLVAAAILACSPVGADVAATRFTGKVVRVRDGDTIEVLRPGAPTRVRVRVFGIDCPERGQAYSQKARQLTSLLAFGREVTVVVRDHDAYGRTVGDVILPDGRDLGLELVTAGLAWQYRRYSNDAKVQAAEDRARAAQRGLWADAHPVPPWEFRHADRKPRPTRKARPPRRTPAAA